MANGIPTDPPNSRTIDFGALVRKTLGDEYHKHEKVYQFSDGRAFESSDYGTQGFYGGTQAIVRTGTAQGGGSDFITLATSANGSPADYQSKLISAVDFATSTQTSRVVDFNMTSKVARVVPPWASNFVLHTGTAQGGGQAVMTLATGAPSALSGTLSITGGAGTWTGGTQAREILAYNGTTKVAAVSKWDAPYLVGTGNSDEGAQATFYLDFTDLGSGAVNTTPAFGTVSPTFTRATTATTIGSDGLVLKGIASGVARAYYDPTTLTYLGYLAEGARTNVSLHSEDASNAAWVKVNASVTANDSIAPDGTATADRVTPTMANGYINGPILTADINGLAYSGSIYLRSVTGTKTVRFSILKEGDTAITGITPVDVVLTTSWQRVTVSGTAGEATITVYIYVQDISGDSQPWFQWGGQLEAGAFPSSYIPTTTAAVTRNADVLTYPTTGWLNASAGTMFAQFQCFSTSANQRICECQPAGDANNRLFDMLINATPQPSWFGNTASVQQFNIGAGTITANATSITAGCYATNSAQICVNGTLGTEDTSVTPASGTFVLNVGAFDSGSNNLFGPIRRVAYFPQRLLNATLQYITANGLTFSPSTFPRALPDSTTTYRVEKVGPGVNTTYTISA